MDLCTPSPMKRSWLSSLPFLKTIKNDYKKATVGTPGPTTVAFKVAERKPECTVYTAPTNLVKATTL